MKNRLSTSSQRRQCGVATLRTFVTPGSELRPLTANCGAGIPSVPSSDRECHRRRCRQSGRKQETGRASDRSRRQPPVGRRPCATQAYRGGPSGVPVSAPLCGAELATDAGVRCDRSCCRERRGRRDRPRRQSDLRPSQVAHRVACEQRRCVSAPALRSLSGTAPIRRSARRPRFRYRCKRALDALAGGPAGGSELAERRPDRPWRLRDRCRSGDPASRG